MSLDHTCRVCGSPVTVHQSGEGTGSYVPLGDELAHAAGDVLDAATLRFSLYGRRRLRLALDRYQAAKTP